MTVSGYKKQQEDHLGVHFEIPVRDEGGFG
jgi:hypothetical protein